MPRTLGSPTERLIVTITRKEAETLRLLATHEGRALSDTMRAALREYCERRDEWLAAKEAELLEKVTVAGNRAHATNERHSGLIPLDDGNRKVERQKPEDSDPEE